MIDYLTQREYREAYELHLQGKIKILSFVRSEVWNFKDDRKELQRYIYSLNLNKKMSETIVSHTSKKADDPNFIIKFINEVGKNKETVTALNNDDELPTGNWIHVFSSFRDIIDVLQPEIFDGTPVEDAVMIQLLSFEIKEILKRLLVKTKKGSIHTPTVAIRNFYAEHDLQKFNVLDTSEVSINAKRWDILSSYGISLMGAEIKTLILPQILTSSVFLEFNKEKSIYQEMPIYNALNTLNQEIKLLNKGISADSLKIIFEHTPRYRDANAENITIKLPEFIGFLFLLQRWSNIIVISKSVMQYISGEPFHMPKIFSKSPVPEMNTELNEETPTDDEVLNFISKS